MTDCARCSAGRTMDLNKSTMRPFEAVYVAVDKDKASLETSERNRL